MYSLTKYNEVDFDFIYKSTLSRFSFLKSKRNIIKPKLRFMILFRNILEPDFTKVYLHILMLWIMIGKAAKVGKIGQNLRRGIRYYRFIIKLNILDNFRFFRFLEFLSYSLFDYIGFRNYYFVNQNNDASFYLKNISGFSNLRFSDNFYLSGMPNDLIVNFLKQKEIIDYFDSVNFFLSLFKLI